MTHNNFDDLFDDATKSYNAPPPAPREQMWDAIARARTESNVIPISSAHTVARTQRPIRRWLISAAGIAAVLMAGIVIGRATRAPATTSAVAVQLPTTQAPPADSPATTVVPRDVAAAPEQVALTPRASGSQRIAAQPRGNRSLDVSGDDGAYRLAVVGHLMRTEVLLTNFRSQSMKTGDAAKLDAQFASLAKDLLTTTRLLLARRNGDPTITRLLEDLELVLMQLSQYATDGRRTDFDAVNQSIEKRNVLPKLRSTIPAGTAMSSGT